LATGRYAALARWLDRLPHENHRSHLGLANLAEELLHGAPRNTPSSPSSEEEIGGKRHWVFRRAIRGSPAKGADSPDVERSLVWPVQMSHDVLIGQAGDATSHASAPLNPLNAGPPGVSSPAHAAPFCEDGRAHGSTVYMEARLLGPFDLLVNDQTVQHWRGNRGRMLLAYLLLHRERPLTGDGLGGVFWPDAAPEVVRNRLHVALYGLQRDLRALTPHPIVIHGSRGFSFHPRVDLWIDVEAFDEAIVAARNEGTPTEAALARYETALRLYRGELLEDTPFEEWTLLCRERLRLQYLEALDHVAKLRFELGRYADCLDACQHLLPGDLCREDIHRLIMLCYARMNQPHLAARQYHQCRRQLRDELGIEPSETTQQLFERIRRQKFI
jgi:SARP family transcriptional regulator, regulator of embCAB operon